MPQKKARRESKDATAELQQQTEGLANTTHEVVMEQLWKKLYNNEELASRIYIMMSTGALDSEKKQESGGKTMTSNNKNYLAPREVWDEVLKKKHRGMFNHFSGKVKSEVCDAVCFITNQDSGSAVLSKNVDVCVSKICTLWDEHAPNRLPQGFPQENELVKAEHINQLHYWSLKTEEKDGKQLQYLSFLDGKATRDAELPQSWQGTEWTVKDSLNYKKAKLVSTADALDEHSCVSLFIKLVIVHSPPTFHKQVPWEESSPRTPRGSPRTALSPIAPNSNASTGGLSAASSPAAVSEATAPPPPPPPGAGGALH